MSSPINIKAASYEALLKEFQTFVKSLPDYARWKDFYASSAGQTLLELMSGMGAYLFYHSAAARREVYLDSAKLKTSVYNIGAMLGYESNRLTAPTFRVRLKETISHEGTPGFFWPDRFVPVGKYQGKEIVLLNDYSYGDNDSLRGKVFDICIGTWERFITKVDETKPFLKMFFENKSIDNALDHISIWVSEAGQSGRAYLTPVRYAEELQPPESFTKVLVRTLADGVVLVFGDGEFGFKPICGSSVAFDFVSTVGRSDVEVSSALLKTKISWEAGAGIIAENIEDIEVLNPGYGEDSIDKIKTLARGYFAARRRMLTIEDHRAVLMSYPDIVSVGLRKKPGTFGASTRDYCCTIQMCPLFTDEHMVNQDMREVQIVPVSSEWINGIQTIRYQVVNPYSLEELFVTDQEVSLRLYPKTEATPLLPTGVIEYPFSYKIELGTGEQKNTFILKNLDDDLPVFSFPAPFSSQVGKLTMGLHHYLEADRLQGSRKRLSAISSWDIDLDKVVTVSNLDLLTGMLVSLYTPEQVLSEVQNVCLPYVFHNSVVTKGEGEEWLVERLSGNEYSFRYLNGERVPLTLYRNTFPFGRAYLKWDAETRVAQIVDWDTGGNTFRVISGFDLADGQKVWFRGNDPDADQYPYPSFLVAPEQHLALHDKVPWNKPWARATVRGQFTPLSLYQRCYSEFGYNEKGSGPTFRAYLVDVGMNRYRLEDLQGNPVTFTNGGAPGTECWVCWSGVKKNDLLGSREQRSIMEYLEDYKVVGESLELVDPVKTIIQVKMTLVVDPVVVLRELEFSIQAILRDMIYALGATFKPGELVRKVSQIEGVKRIYLQWPTKDKELAYNEYIGFDDSTYLDILVRQANYGDKNHYIPPLDLSITTEDVVVEMEPDFNKGYYSASV